jgi:hypothetical protein
VEGHTLPALGARKLSVVAESQRSYSSHPRSQIAAA